MKISRIALIGATALMFAAGGQKAEAGCYEHVGCSERNYFSDFDLSLFSCEELKLMRNGIYAENGYCFSKPKYRRAFGNRNCRFGESGDVPLNAVERKNILAIVNAERENGCRD